MAKIINKTIIISSHDEGTFEIEKTDTVEGNDIYTVPKGILDIVPEILEFSAKLDLNMNESEKIEDKLPEILEFATKLNNDMKEGKVAN